MSAAGSSVPPKSSFRVSITLRVISAGSCCFRYARRS
ncbi:Uncharacterised protein [Vibrio cholerae]|nr:Uncharacterised protein [Vibrio cholerae]